MKTIKVAFLAALFAFATTSFATLNEDIEAAYTRGDYTAAARDLKTLAERGDRSAQMSLSSMYLAGIGVKKDQAQAYFWAIVAFDGESKWGATLRDLAEDGLSLQKKQEIQILVRNWHPSIANSPGDKLGGFPSDERMPTVTGSGFRVRAGLWRP